MPYLLLSPDGFPIRRDTIYDNPQQALDDFIEWKKTYEQQGYYSNARRERIPLKELDDHCRLIKINPIS